jgi:hypothetical protein
MNYEFKKWEIEDNRKSCMSFPCRRESSNLLASSNFFYVRCRGDTPVSALYGMIGIVWNYLQRQGDHTGIAPTQKLGMTNQI